MTTGPVFTADTSLARVLHALLWALVAAGFGWTGWTFGVQPIATTVQNWRLAQHYREVDAKVVSRTVRLPDGGTDVVVVAVYDVDGKSFLTERLTPADDAAFDEPDNVAVAKSLLPLAKSNASTKGNF